MASKIQLKNWFRTQAKPLASQFAEWMDSYWHKDELIPIASIEGLALVLAGKAAAGANNGGGGASMPPIPILDQSPDMTITCDADFVATYGADPTRFVYYLSYLDSDTQLWTGQFLQPAINAAASPFTIYLNWNRNLNGKAKIILLSQ